MSIVILANKNPTIIDPDSKTIAEKAIYKELYG
jgi:hypothetical protein